jgi:tetratricopeptide (TPR) repeat protein
MPTLQWPDVPTADSDTDRDLGIAESGQPMAEAEPADSMDELDEAIESLEQMAERHGTPVDEMPTLVTAAKKDAGSGEDSVVAEEMEQSAASEPPPQQIDSDPMAWLEQLAIDQSSPLEELPSVADRLLASDIVSQIESGQSADPQLIALAAQAAELDKALSYLEQLAEAQGISLNDASFDQVELDDLHDEGSIASEQMATENVPAPIVASAAVAFATKQNGKEGDNFVQEMPDDPDEALAWLAELEEEAASQADLEAEADPQEMIADTIPAAAEGADALPENEEPETGPVATEAAVNADFLEEMPDDPDQAMAWMAGLAAHQVASHKSQPQAEAASLDEDTEETGPPVGERENPVENADFSLAREALSSGNIEEANGLYRSLLDSGQGGPALIKELETVVADQPEEPQLLRLLGDAYMQDGQLQKALSAYRRGIDHL